MNRRRFLALLGTAFAAPIVGPPLETAARALLPAADYSTAYASKMIRISRELLEDSRFDIEAYLRQELTRNLRREMERQFTEEIEPEILHGTGTNKPRGILRARP